MRTTGYHWVVLPLTQHSSVRELLLLESKIVKVLVCSHQNAAPGTLIRYYLSHLCPARLSEATSGLSGFAFWSRSCVMYMSVLCYWYAPLALWVRFSFGFCAWPYLEYFLFFDSCIFYWTVSLTWLSIRILFMKSELLGLCLFPAPKTFYSFCSHHYLPSTTSLSAHNQCLSHHYSWQHHLTGGGSSNQTDIDNLYMY